MSTIETTPSVATVDSNVAPASGQADGAPPKAEATPNASVGFEQFLSQFRKYESVIVSVVFCYVLPTNYNDLFCATRISCPQQPLMTNSSMRWPPSINVSHNLPVKNLQRS
jgi:hypothetical protein